MKGEAQVSQRRLRWRTNAFGAETYWDYCNAEFRRDAALDGNFSNHGYEYSWCCGAGGSCQVIICLFALCRRSATTSWVMSSLAAFPSHESPSHSLYLSIQITRMIIQVTKEDHPYWIHRHASKESGLFRLLVTIGRGCGFCSHKFHWKSHDHFSCCYHSGHNDPSNDVGDCGSGRDFISRHLPDSFWYWHKGYNSLDVGLLPQALSSHSSNFYHTVLCVSWMITECTREGGEYYGNILLESTWGDFLWDSTIDLWDRNSSIKRLSFLYTLLQKLSTAMGSPSYLWKSLEPIASRAFVSDSSPTSNLDNGPQSVMKINGGNGGQELDDWHGLL